MKTNDAGSSFEGSSGLDPITLAVIQNGLTQVCNEMDLAFVRSLLAP